MLYISTRQRVHTHRLATQKSICVLWRLMAPPESRIGTLSADCILWMPPIIAGIKLKVRNNISGR